MKTPQPDYLEEIEECLDTVKSLTKKVGHSGFIVDTLRIAIKRFVSQEIQRAKQEVLDDFREKFVQIAIENDKIEAPLKGLVLYTKTLGLITKIEEEMK